MPDANTAVGLEAVMLLGPHPKTVPRLVPFLADPRVPVVLHSQTVRTRWARNNISWC